MKDEKEKVIRFADLFGGVGGFRLGIEKATQNVRFIQQESTRHKSDTDRTTPQHDKSIRTKCVFYNDNDKYAVQTYNKNFKENYKATDIRTIKTSDIPDFDMLCGGFPCQAFSIAGKRKGFRDTRGTLFFEIERIIKDKRPSIVFLENVKGLLNHDKGETFATILHSLWKLGYDVQWMVLNSKFFGVPQNRERVFIIGSLRETSRPEILPFRESNQNFDREVSYCLDSNYWKGTRNLNKKQRQMILDINQAQRVYGTNGTNIALKGLGGGQGAKTGLYNVTEYRHSMRGFKGYQDTSVSIKSSQGSGCQIILNKIRRLTPIECERLQGFPDNWTEGVSDTQRYKQMGNAVTINVIEAIAKKLLE